jgi:hypothetical protein
LAAIYGPKSIACSQAQRIACDKTAVNPPGGCEKRETAQKLENRKREMTDTSDIQAAKLHAKAGIKPTM